MDFLTVSRNIDWARKHIWLALFSLMSIAIGYACYSFIGGYATKFGESYASEFAQFRQSVASYTVIDTFLHAYMTRYHASRIAIARFHDNVRDTGNNHIFYADVENSIAQPGIAIIDPFNVPANVFSNILPSLMDGKGMFIHIQDLPENVLKQHLFSRGSKAEIFVPIEDLSDHLVGMIMLDWIDDRDVPTPEQAQDIILNMKDVANRIGAYYSAKE